MTRDEARQRLWELVFGDPSPEDARALEEAARQDPDLAREVAVLREMAQASRSLPAPPLPPPVRRRVLQEARRRARGREATTSWWTGWSPVALAAAATVVVAVVGAHLWQHQRETLSSRGPEGLPGVAVRPEEPPATPEKPALEDETAALGQGTQALASGPSGFKDEERKVPAAATPESSARGAAPARKAESVHPSGVATRDRKGREAGPPAAAPVPAAGGGRQDLDRLEASGGFAGGDGWSGAGRAAPVETGGGLGGGWTARKASRSAGAPAAAQEAPAATTREAEAAGDEEAPRCPGRVRDLRRQGRVREALAEARACLQQDLTGEDLLETLDLAARIARELGRHPEAEDYLQRLRALPGGEERANGIPGAPDLP